MQFDKYKHRGAYHGLECDRQSPNFNPALEARYQVLLKKVARAKQVLEVGCGDGYLLSLVSYRATRVFGIDSDPYAVRLAEEKLQCYPNCRVIRADSYSLPFHRGTFDVVLLADVIEHLEDAHQRLKEIKKVMTPDGSLVLTTPKWRPDRQWDRHHFKEYQIGELIDLLRRYFAEISIDFFWPLIWSKIYANRLGWHLVRAFSKSFYNPFLQAGTDPKHFGQILAVCR